MICLMLRELRKPHMSLRRSFCCLAALLVAVQLAHSPEENHHRHRSRWRCWIDWYRLGEAGGPPVPGGAPFPVAPVRTLRAADRHDPGWSNLAAFVRQVFSLPPEVAWGWCPLDYCRYCRYYGLGVATAKTLLRLGANPLAMCSTITLATTRLPPPGGGGDRRQHLPSAGLCGRVKATGTVLREASMPWSPQRHALHCSEFRRVVEVLLLVE